MLSDDRQFLLDVVESAATIQRFCLGRDVQEYDQDVMLHSACERQLEIIGEAMTRLRDRHPHTFSEIENGHQIIALRNRLIHGYDSVDSTIVWDVITTKLPKLEAVARKLLELAR